MLIDDISVIAIEAIEQAAGEASRATALSMLEREAALLRETQRLQIQAEEAKKRNRNNLVITGLTCFIGGLVAGISIPSLLIDKMAVNNAYSEYKIQGNITAHSYLTREFSITDPNIFYSYNSNIKPVLYNRNVNKPDIRLSRNETFFDTEFSHSKPDGWRQAAFTLSEEVNAWSNVYFGVKAETYQPVFDYTAMRCYICSVQPNVDYDSFPHNAIVVESGGGMPDWMILSNYFSYNEQNYIRTLAQGVKLTDSNLQKSTFIKNLFDDVMINLNLVNKPVFKRIFNETLGISDEKINKCGMNRNCNDTVNVNEGFIRILNVLRSFYENLTVGDDTIVPRFYFYRLNENLGITDTFKRYGEFFRGLFIEARIISDAMSRSEYTRIETDTVCAESSLLRKLSVFIKLVSTSFVRDFILRRFLIANEELLIKSCITREINLDSKIA